MFKSINRFGELYESLGIKIVNFKGHIWREYQRMVVPE